MTDFLKSTPHPIFLSYKNGEPVFVQGEIVGHQVSLFFGDDNIGDVDVPEVVFRIKIRLDEPTYSIHLDIFSPALPYEWGYSDLNSKVQELVEELNQSIRDKQPFDFAKYVDFWAESDKYFDVKVITAINSENFP